MPCTDTGDLAETLVCLARQLLRSPTSGNTLETVTLGDSNDIDVLVLLKHRRDLHRLLEQALGVLDFIRD